MHFEFICCIITSVKRVTNPLEIVHVNIEKKKVTKNHSYPIIIPNFPDECYD